MTSYTTTELRDRLAETALRQMLAALGNTPGTISTDRSDEMLRRIAAFSYRMADAMLAARGER